MAFDPVTAIANVANTVLGRVLPDKPAQDAAKAQLLDMQLQGELAQVTAQIQVNQEEAKSPSVFVAGWRPAVGWVCASAFAYAFILQPFAVLVLTAFHRSLDPHQLPVLDMKTIMGILGGMLGFGGLRSIDKANGVDTTSVGN